MKNPRPAEAERGPRSNVESCGQSVSDAFSVIVPSNTTS